MGAAFTYRQKWISVIVAIRPVFPDPVTYVYVIPVQNGTIELTCRFAFDSSSYAWQDAKTVD